MDLIEAGVAAPIVGLVGGILLGLAARRGRFCTLGAIEDALYGQSWDRIRMWAVALGTAILGTFVAAHFDIVDRSVTLYAQQSWNPVASIAGGLIFGYGMAIAGNCGYGALARLGGGDLRSLVIVIVMGVTAYAVIGGPLAQARLFLFPVDIRAGGDATGYADLVGSGLGIPPLIPATVIALAFWFWAFSDPGFRTDRGQVGWGIAVGLAILTGWLGTNYVASLSFEVVMVESHAFTAPSGETILYLMTSSAGGGPGFAIGSVLGVVIGALLGSVSKGHFRWEACDDPGELGRQLCGGALMGVGGVLAVGCSVGQGLTAFSTLAFSAPVVLAAIFAGAALGLRQLIQGFEPV